MYRRKFSGLVAFACVLMPVFSAAPASAVPEDFAIVKKLAGLYDYSGIRDLNLKLSEGTARFYPGKSLKLDFRSAYEMFPEDTAKYFIRESFFTRQVFLDVPADTGKIPGVLDFKSLLLDSGNCQVTPDSLHPDRKSLTIGNLLPAWLALGFMPVVPIRQVSARGWLDARSLEIRHLDVEVYSPGALPENEIYSLDLDQYRTVQGRLVPGRIRYSLQGMAAELNDSSRTYLAKTSASNQERNTHLLGLYQEELKKGNAKEAQRLKRASTRTRTLKRRILEAKVAGQPYYEVRLAGRKKGAPK